MASWLLRISNGLYDQSRSRNFQYLALVVITLVACALRLYKLGEWSFWIDEIYTINRAQAHYSSLALTLRHIPPHTNWVPVSLLLIAGALNILGVSEWSVRLVPALIGGLSIPILYFPIRRVFTPTVALISILLLAFSPWHILWSQNGRFYVALMLLYALTLFTLFMSLEYDRPAYLIFAVPLFYLAMSERMLAGFAIPTVAVYMLAVLLFRFPIPPGFNPRNVLLLSVPIVGGLLVELHSIVTSGTSRFFGDADAFVGNPVDSPVRILILILFSIGLPVAVLGLFTGSWSISQRNRTGLFILVSAIVPILILIGLSPWVFVVERYALITLPAWLILSAIAIERLVAWTSPPGRWLGAALLIILLVDALGSSLMYYQLNNGNRPDWRGAFAYVEAHMAPNDIVVSSRPEIGEFYFESEQDIVEMATLNLDLLIDEKKAAWFVVDSEAIWYAPQSTTNWMEQNARLLFVWYLRTREQIDLKVYYYQPLLDSSK